jgi:hypothetical protein
VSKINQNLPTFRPKGKQPAMDRSIVVKLNELEEWRWSTGRCAGNPAAAGALFGSLPVVFAYFVDYHVSSMTGAVKG